MTAPALAPNTAAPVPSSSIKPAGKKRKRGTVVDVLPPPYTRAYLDTLTVGIMTEQILKKYNIRKGKTKSHTITLILQRLSPTQEERTLRDITLSHIKETQFPSPSPLTTYYKTHFNYIDRLDRLWYQHHFGYPIRRWRSKLVISILDVAMINSYVLYSEFHKVSYTDFRRSLARALMDE
jgi:hypothetical protein